MTSDGTLYQHGARSTLDLCEAVGGGADAVLLALLRLTNLGGRPSAIVLGGRPGDVGPLL